MTTAFAECHDTMRNEHTQFLVMPGRMADFLPCRVHEPRTRSALVQQGAVLASAMANMFVPVFLDPGPDSLLHSLFLAFCETGVPKTMYTGCAVCKAWNVRVKDMTEQEMSALCSAACGDTTMCAFWSRLRPIALPFNATGAQMEPIKVLPQAAPSTRSVLRAAVTGDRAQIDPLLWVLLNHLATMAMAVACKPPHGKSFAHEFTMDLRGYSY